MDNYEQIVDGLINSYILKQEHLDWNNIEQHPKCIKKCMLEVTHQLSNIFHTNNLSNVNRVTHRLFEIIQNRRQLASLQLLPVIEQRTPIWYDTRNQLITASDFGDALGIDKFGKKSDIKKFFKKK